MAVDAGFIAYLKAEALYTAAASPNAAQWPQGSETEILSPILTRANAVTEGTRQATLFGGPNARDRIVVRGSRKDLIGKCITAKHSRFGYSAGANAFVLGATENPNNTTTLTVLKRLP